VFYGCNVGFMGVGVVIIPEHIDENVMRLFNTNQRNNRSHFKRNYHRPK
jgi:hypothetical protein